MTDQNTAVATITSVVANTPTAKGDMKFVEWRLGMPMPSDEDKPYIAPTLGTPGNSQLGQPATPGHPGQEAHVSSTVVAKILDMGDTVDFYILPKPNNALSQQGFAIIFSMPQHNIHQITRVAPLAVWTAMIEQAEAELLADGDDDEDDEDGEGDTEEEVEQPSVATRPVATAPPGLPVGMPDPAQFVTAGVSSAAPQSNPTSS
jgi:hypothetical protein